MIQSDLKHFELLKSLLILSSKNANWTCFFTNVKCIMLPSIGVSTSKNSRFSNKVSRTFPCVVKNVVDAN